MDKITDFFKEIRSRFYSPFFSSFILAWIIINWRVPIALLFYKQSEWQAAEHTTYVGLIERRVTISSGILWPVISAVCYTLVAPLLKNLIQTLNAYLDAKGMDWTLTAAKKGKISVDRYIQLRASYKVQEDALLKIYEDESKYLVLNGALHQKVEENRNKFENMSAGFEQLRGYSEVRTYNGHWELTYADDNGQQKTEIVTINQGDICTTDRTGKLIFRIVNIGYSAQTSEIMLVLEDRRNVTINRFFIVMYCPNNERAIFINRQPDQIIERMARPTFLRQE